MTRGLPVSCRGVEQVYAVDGDRVVALHAVDLDVPAGELVALLGPSGSGKSTLLCLLGGLLRPTAGELRLGDVDVAQCDERELLRLRARVLGFVAQGPARNLLPYATSAENVAYAQAARPRAERDGLPRALDVLDRVGLAGVAAQRAARLSGGEQQRLALAVALGSAPRVLLADEPTSQLDHHNRDLVVAALRRVAEDGTTVVMVTHDVVVAQAADRAVHMRDGRITDTGWAA